MRIKGGIMDDKFLCGVILGMVGGAVLVTNSVKARKAVKDGQEMVIEKINDMNKRADKKSEN